MRSSSTVVVNILFLNLRMKRFALSFFSSYSTVSALYTLTSDIRSIFGTEPYMVVVVWSDAHFADFLEVKATRWCYQKIAR